MEKPVKVKTKQISELKVRDNLEQLECEVVEVEEIRQTKDGKDLQQVYVGDGSGTIKHTLFEDKAGKLTVGDKIRFTNVWVSEYNGDLTLNTKRDPSSGFEILEPGDGTSKLKRTPTAMKSDSGLKLSARQTAVQAAGRVLAQSSTSVKDLLEYAEKIEEWLNRP